MSEERITELEIKVAYLEDSIQLLNDIICDQQKQISCLEQSCKLLSERIKSIADPESINQGIEIPPHY